MAINKSRILEDMVDRVQRMLDSGERPPFQKPWTPLYGELSKPHNPVTSHAYSGMNAFDLALEGALRGYDDPRWMGYQQAKDQGWQVRKGEKAATIYLPVSIRINAEQPEGRGQGEGGTAGEGSEQGKESKLLVFKAVKVFNAQQIDGIPPMEKVAEQDLPPKSAEIDAIAQVMGVPIQETPGDRAFYSPSQDRITLPLRSTFHDQHGYDATRLHELSHATGHPERLNRDMGGRFGSPRYAAEEVTAEVSAWLTSQALAIPHAGGNPDMTAEQHAAYIAGWAEAIKADPKAFAKSIDNGLKASQHLQKALEQGRENGLLLNPSIEQAHDQEPIRHTTLVLTPRTDVPPHVSDGEHFIPVSKVSGRVERMDHKAREMVMMTIDNERVTVLVPDGNSFCNFHESGDFEKDTEKFCGLVGKDIDLRVPNEKSLIVFDRATGDELYNGISERARTPHYLMDSTMISQDGKSFYVYPESGRQELAAVRGKLAGVYDTNALEIQTKTGPLLVYSNGSPMVPNGGETDMNRYRGLVGKEVTVTPQERGLNVLEAVPAHAAERDASQEPNIEPSQPLGIGDDDGHEIGF